jgi:putative ABC transport system substrate-binding protein
MKRRDFLKVITGSVAPWPLSAQAQQSQRTRHIAWLGIGRADVPSPYVDGLRVGLRDLGLVEGRNLRLSLFWATGRADMDAVAREVVASNPEVIVTQELMVYAVQPLKPVSPIVFGFSGDPVEGKLVQSYARPGGNITGMTYLALDLVGKRIELLKEWIPKIERIAVLARPQHPGEHKERQATEDVVGKLGLALSYFPMREVSELDEIFRGIAQQHCDAVVVFPDAVMFGISDRIAHFALEARLPSVSGWAPFAKNGLLLTYGPNVRDIYRSLARYADQILKGAKAADLPVELPARFELAVNMKSAKLLGLDVPLYLQQLADEVIE